MFLGPALAPCPSPLVLTLLPFVSTRFQLTLHPLQYRFILIHVPQAWLMFTGLPDDKVREGTVEGLGLSNWEQDGVDRVQVSSQAFNVWT